jgi:hypothetical protein
MASLSQKLEIPLADPAHQRWAEWALDMVCQAIRDALGEYDDDASGSPEEEDEAIERFPVVHDDGVLRGQRRYIQAALRQLDHEGRRLVNETALAGRPGKAVKTQGEIEGLAEILRAALMK